jgi:WD40 repeat protein
MKKAIILFTIVLVPGVGRSAEPASYSKQIRPFLQRYCVECHNSHEPKSDLNLETYAALMAGGEHGVVLKAGKAADSRIVRMVEGKSKPAMPPRKSRQPTDEERSLLRAWIEAGAKDDSVAKAAVILPALTPMKETPPPVAAVAYHPNGKLLAAAGRKAVELIDVSSGDIVATLPVAEGKVTAAKFSPDGNRLVVASGNPGERGIIRVFAGNPLSLSHEFQAHADLIYDIAFSPDGKSIATASYDRLVRIWDCDSSREIRSLKDHSDAVYAVAFSPDGKLLATGSADRSVKIWEVATGQRLHTLSESTDWVYSVTWSPDGRSVAAGGVDRTIRIWDVSPKATRLRHSVFAHTGPIVRVAYSNDGRILFSIGEDRVLKTWDAARMVDQNTSPMLNEVPFTFAIRPDAKQVAIGRFDGVLCLLDPMTMKTVAEPLPAKPQRPVLEHVEPGAVTRGSIAHLRVTGKHMQEAESVVVRGFKEELFKANDPHSGQVDILIPQPTAPGSYELKLKGRAGESNALMLVVDAYPAVHEQSLPHASPGNGQALSLPVTVAGSLARAGEIDWYRFEAKAGQEIGIQAQKGPASNLEAALILSDGTRTLAESDNGLLGFRCAQSGTYSLGIRDREFRGEPAMTYRMHVGDLPVVTGVFPLGLQRGTETEIHLQGVNLGSASSVKVRAPADAVLGSRLPAPISTPQGFVAGSATVVVGEFPETTGSRDIPIPGTANGRVDGEQSASTWRFVAKKGQRLLIEVEARRLGSPLDSTLEILDSAGKPLPRATLRCLSKTFVAFRDHDSSTTGIRIETWPDLAMNDYLLLGGELVRIDLLPKNPDDDCHFFGEGGQRLGYLGTTPTHHSMGEPLYKVGIFPPGTTFPANGLPVVTLYYRNDDGGPGFGKDSCLTFDAPADGEYQVRVADARGQTSPEFAYRLTIRPPRPDFSVSFNPTAPTIAKGAARAISVSARRIDGFDGAIKVRLVNQPPGFTAPETTIPAGENSTSFALFCEPNASVPQGQRPLRIVARATVDDKEITREASGAVPKFEPTGDLVTTTEQQHVSVKAGGETRLTVNIGRQNGYAGRVPLEVRGLPHGVRVLDIGLNGILITERETSRTIVIYAEPWVVPGDQPFVVLSKSERKGTEHAAKSVLLTVMPKE